MVTQQQSLVSITHNHPLNLCASRSIRPHLARPVSPHEEGAVDPTPSLTDKTEIHSFYSERCLCPNHSELLLFYCVNGRILFKKMMEIFKIKVKEYNRDSIRDISSLTQLEM